MKILFITDNFPPEVNAPANRTYEHCLEWTKMGHQVTVITCQPNFPQGKIYKNYKNKWYSEETINNIKVIRVWSYMTSNSGFIKRILDYLSFSFTSFIHSLFIKTDVIIATSPQFFTTWSAYLLSKLKRKPWIFELRDLWPESIKTVGAMNDNIIIKILEKIEYFLYKDADLIVSVTDSFKETLVHNHINQEKIIVIKNGINIESKNQVKFINIKDQLNLKNNFTVGYIGTHGMAHNLEFIIKSIYQEEIKYIDFIFIGDGSQKKECEKLVEKYQLTNVKILGQKNRLEALSYLNSIDVSLSHLKKNDAFKKVIPSKIFEAALFNKPLLLGVDGEAKNIVKKYETGIYFEPENNKNFKEKLLLLQKNYLYYQKNCDKLVKDFNRNVLAKNMINIIEEKLKIKN